MLLPAYFTPPLSEDFESDADLLLKIVKLAYRDMDNPNGIRLDEWQSWLLRAILERYPKDHPDADKAGQLRWRQVVVSIPRQSGKSLIAGLLGVNHLVTKRGQCLSIASSREQGQIVYQRVLHTVLGHPSLKKRFKKATELRGIVSADGLSRYDVRPAKEGALQGIAIDLCLADELHLWSKGMWSAVVLGTSARNGQVIGITTAGDDSSETLIDLYKQGHKAIAGDPSLERFGFFVWQAPEGAEVLDPASVLASNPAVECGRIPLDRVMSDLAIIPEHEARRYRLNQFVSGMGASWLPPDLFHKCGGNGITDIHGSVIGLDITSKWEFAAISAAKSRDDVVETELVASLVQPSENQLYEMVKKLYSTHSAIAIVLDSSRAPNLAKRLKQNGYTTWSLSTREVAAACELGYALFKTQKVIHNNDPLILSQVGKGVARTLGDSWYLSRKDSHGDIDGLMSMLFAMYVADGKEESGLGVF